MAQGKHLTQKQPTDSTYDARWSGVTYAPECKYSRCPDCRSHTHHEGGSHYCPNCDDYVRKTDSRCKYD
jgi:hypothetical protein